mgnify:CR=1 FL=1
MLRQTNTDDAVATISADLKLYGTYLDTWQVDALSSRITIALTLAYQEGMRDAFLKMGSYLKK